MATGLSPSRTAPTPSCARETTAISPRRIPPSSTRCVASTRIQVTAAVARLGLEGVIAKRRDSKYEAGVRSHAWVKLKLDRQQEFVVGGFRPNGKSVDALLVGYFDKRALHFAGKVRAGMTPRLRALLFDQLKGLASADGPFVDLPNSKKSHWGTGVTVEDMLEMTWVRPRVVVQVHFVEWTTEGQQRHAAFMGVRDDKPASQVTREPG